LGSILRIREQDIVEVGDRVILAGQARRITYK